MATHMLLKLAFDLDYLSRTGLTVLAQGPIIPVMSWTTEDEVIRRANDTDSGLGACVWAKDIADAERIGRRLEAGSVWFNSREKPNPAGYLSGQKESGFGGELGKQGLVSYYNTQSLHIYKASASSH
jgi:acyl-CoA reductase-like NAD-dependent aldehyde dehydrogenase